MKITKRQLRRIIKEEKSKILLEGVDDRVYEFEEIMEQIGELVQEAFRLAGRPRDAEVYWHNGILGYINPERYGIMSRSRSMADTLEEIRGEGGEEDMMEQGYNDGRDGSPPAFPDNEIYMINYDDGKKDYNS